MMNQIQRWIHVTLVRLTFLLTLFSMPTYALQDPSLTVVGNGPLVPQSAQQSIPISFTNMQQVDIEILKVTDPNQLLEEYYLLDQLSSWELREMKHAYESVFADRYELPKAEQDVSTSARLPIPHSLSSGWYLVVVKAPGDYSDFQVKHMFLTDLGIQARVNRSTGAFTVTRLSSGNEVAGAKVGLMQAGEWVDVKVTDEQGVVEFSEEITRTDMVIVEAEGEYSMLPMREVPLDLSEFDIGGREFQQYEAYVYSNRDLVKPGETLPVNILLRDQDGMQVSEEEIDRLFLTLVDPQKGALLQQELTAQAAGYYDYQLQTSASWRMGRYTVELRIDPSDPNPISQYHFQLEEFVPERMDLFVSDLAPFVLAGQNNRVNLEGRYLFGTPASGNVLKTELTYQPTQHFKGKYSDFYVGQRFSLDHYYHELDDKTLSEQGTLSLNLPSVKPDALKGPVEIEVNFSLQESGGAAIQRTGAYTTWKDSPIPGIKPASDTFAYQSEAEFEIAMLAADGQSLREGNVEVTLEYNQGPYYWVYEEGSGWSREEQPAWVSVSKQTIGLAQDSTRVSFPVDWGDYRLKVMDLDLKTETLFPFYAGWYQGYRQLKVKPGHLNLTPDKLAYLQDDNSATVTVTNPMAGSLFVALETDELIWSQRIAVEKGDVQIDVPLQGIDGEPLSRHDIYLTATLTGISGEQPKRYVGVMPLKLDRSDRKLDISVSLPERIEPMKSLSIPVEVKNIHADYQDDTWVTVSIVDKGITNLTRYQPREPHEFLFGQRRYSADIVDLFSRIYQLRPDPFAQSRFGSDLNERLDNNNDDLVESKTIILMSNPVKLEAGKAVIELDIPDYNGEGQVVVTAFNGAQVGQLSQDNAISAPVVAELSVPRFVVPGDSTTTTIDIFNNSGEDKAFTVELWSSDNVKPLSVSLIRSLLSNDALLLKKLELADGERWSQNVAFKVDSENWTERANLQLKVTDGAKKTDIDRAWSIPIRASMPLLVQASSVKLAASESYQVAESLWDGMSTVQGQLGELHISATPVLSVTEQTKGLLRYPYGCAEQTTSKAWPFLLEHPELEALQSNALAQQPNGDDVAKNNRELIAEAVRRLKNMQKESGGFGLWDSYGEEQYWLTLYITEFLNRAKLDYPDIIPEGMLEQAYDRIRDYLNFQGDGRNLLVKAYAAYLLSEQGLVSYSDLDFDGNEYMTELTKLHIAAAFNNVGATNTAKLVLESATVTRNPSVYHNDYGSDLRDLSLGILLLNKLANNAELRSDALALQADYIEAVATRSAEDNWLSTQERAALLRAAVLTENKNSQQPLHVALNGESLNRTGAISQSLNTDTKVSNQGQDPIYLKVLAQGYMQAVQYIEYNHPFNTIQVQHGRDVRRQWLINGKPLPASQADTPHTQLVNIGDRITVLINIKLDETINNALIVDRIPAGFVLENPNLGQGVSIENGDDRFSHSNHSEYRHDRYVVSVDLAKGGEYQYGYTMRAEVQGEYTVPPLFIEAMYRPEKHYIGGRAPSDANQQHRVIVKALP